MVESLIINQVEKLKEHEWTFLLSLLTPVLKQSKHL